MSLFNHPQDALNYERIKTAIEYLTEHFKDQPSLDQVAEKVHLSPFHFQRMFTDWAGVSPKKFLKYLTLNHLQGKITEIPNVLAMAEEAGLSSQSRVYDLFVTLEAVTPQQYKSSGKGLNIRYGYHVTPFGLCFMAATERGICGMAFVDEAQQRTEYEQFAKKWAFAKLIHDPAYTQPLVAQIFTPQQVSQLQKQRLQVLVQGTNFQVKVWEALLKIPMGAVTTYQQIATAIGNPKANRAVGSAVGSNPIAYLIPCHRVIRKEGKLGNYHWDPARKKAIVGWEMAQVEISS
ncbi:MAG TPA: 6-O-methylguanine DNA methyltransferase [Microscillaceae bacterium]|nr:6-O-methylguanine DNA methyltransferase [Microscillaceae bacterium]